MYSQPFDYDRLATWQMTQAAAQFATLASDSGFDDADGAGRSARWQALAEDGAALAKTFQECEPPPVRETGQVGVLLEVLGRSHEGVANVLFGLAKLMDSAEDEADYRRLAERLVANDAAAGADTLASSVKLAETYQSAPWTDAGLEHLGPIPIPLGNLEQIAKRVRKARQALIRLVAPWPEKHPKFCAYLEARSSFRRKFALACEDSRLALASAGQAGDHDARWFDGIRGQMKANHRRLQDECDASAPT